MAVAMAAAGLMGSGTAQAQPAAAGSTATGIAPVNAVGTAPGPVPAAAAASTATGAGSVTALVSAPVSASGGAPGTAAGTAADAGKPADATGGVSTAESPAAPCEAEDAETADGDANSGLASESFAAQRVRQRPTPATRIACALKRGRRAAALKIADEFLAGHPRDAQVRFLRAVILGDLNRPTDAAAVLESLIEDFPELAEPYNNLAAIRANEGNLGLAEHYLQLAIAAAPGYVTARENLGDLYISLAAAAYDQALRLAPDNAGVRRKLGMTRELDGRLRTPR
jgi:Flp pilus assembly protein TadD